MSLTIVRHTIPQEWPVMKSWRSSGTAMQTYSLPFTSMFVALYSVNVFQQNSVHGNIERMHVSLRQSNIWILKVEKKMAEGKGFEPPKGISSFNDLANRRLQPLGHPSAGVMGSWPKVSARTHVKCYTAYAVLFLTLIVLTVKYQKAFSLCFTIAKKGPNTSH